MICRFRRAEENQCNEGDQSSRDHSRAGRESRQVTWKLMEVLVTINRILLGPATIWYKIAIVIVNIAHIDISILRLI